MTTMDEQATLAAAVAATSVSPAEPASPPRLVLDGVSKRWGKNDPPLLHGLDLELPPGTLALIAGRNGAGKTTLLRIVANIIAADRGTIWLDGSSPASNRREYQRRVGFLSAGSTGVYARVSVAQHLDFWHVSRSCRQQSGAGESAPRSRGSTSKRSPPGGPTGSPWASVSVSGWRWPSCMGRRSSSSTSHGTALTTRGSRS